MATAEELLAAAAVASEADATEEILVVDPKTRVIAIPAELKILGVKSDDDVKRLHFTMPRFYGEFDLYDFAIRVNFENASGGGDFYDVEDKAVSADGDNLTFTWLVDRFAFQEAGNVTFSLCLKLYDDDGIVVKEWNTTIASLPVLPGLETMEAIITSNTNALDRILFRLYAVEAASGIGQDGYYTIVKMEEKTEGVVFTIVNQDGEVEAIVRHGKAPVRGEDYWTDTDQAIITNAAAEYARDYVETWAPSTVAVTLAADGWTDNKQTVPVNGVKVDSIIVVSPDPSRDNLIVYVNAAVRCVAQDTGTLTFQCEAVPESDVIANVAIHYNTNKYPVLYPFSTTTITSNGVTFTDNGDGTVTANGTANDSGAYFAIRNRDTDPVVLGKGTYTLTGCPPGGADPNGYYLAIRDGNSVGVGIAGNDIGRGYTFAVTESATVGIMIGVSPGVTVSNKVFRPQLERDSISTITVYDDGNGNVTIV